MGGEVGLRVRGDGGVVWVARKTGMELLRAGITVARGSLPGVGDPGRRGRGYGT